MCKNWLGSWYRNWVLFNSGYAWYFGDYEYQDKYFSICFVYLYSHFVFHFLILYLVDKKEGANNYCNSWGTDNRQ